MSENRISVVHSTFNCRSDHLFRITNIRPENPNLNLLNMNVLEDVLLLTSFTHRLVIIMALSSARAHLFYYYRV
jgi:hypothetical protein